jgi:selenium-binding protein 1
MSSQKRIRCGVVAASSLVLGAVFWLVAPAAVADETCQSPYMAKITSVEDFLYVWTLGEKGVGDESDKLVTIDVRPGSKTYGEVIHSVSVGGRHEAHHRAPEASSGRTPSTHCPAGC